MYIDEIIVRFFAPEKEHIIAVLNLRRVSAGTV